jgi:hypothetical protein
MITAIILLAIIIAIAAYLTHTLHKDEKDDDFLLSPPPTYTKEELDNIKLAEELYNKDLRPVVAKKAKPAPELEVVEPEFVAKEEKVFSDDAVINTEAIKEIKEAKSEFPIDKPKKKRKYYPKKTK